MKQSQESQSQAQCPPHSGPNSMSTLQKLKISHNIKSINTSSVSVFDSNTYFNTQIYVCKWCSPWQKHTVSQIALTQSIFELETYSLHKKCLEFCQNCVICLGGYAGKNVYNACKNSALFSDDASGANRCYVVAHCAPPQNGTLGNAPIWICQLILSC